MSAAIVPLPWDSAFFGFPVARLARTRLDEAALAAALDACRAQRIRCAYLLLDADDVHGAELAQARGFALRDVRLELDRPLTAADAAAAANGTPVGPASADQLPALETLARDAFVGSRFFADPGFARGRCRELYVAFVRRGDDERTRRLTLASEAGDGFVVCGLDADASTGTIELIAVAERARGRGVGAALVAGALATFAEAELSRASVATQAANVASQRLYQRAGFRTARTALWLHRWFA